MDRCPLCRATLNGADTCRRCRAELRTVQRVERDGQALVDTAIHRLSLDDATAAARLLRRALALHATSEARALWWLVTASSGRVRAGDEGDAEAA
jgi:hypothetical protein